MKPSEPRIMRRLLHTTPGQAKTYLTSLIMFPGIALDVCCASIPIYGFVKCLSIHLFINKGCFIPGFSLQESFHPTGCGCIQQQSTGTDTPPELAQCHEGL